MSEGVDYSSTANDDWTGLATALKNAGKTFAVRYVVTDKSPAYRGITRAEADALKAAGIEIVVVHEGTANRMKDGQAAGVADAQTAQANLVAAGLPDSMPIYFACDFDATPGEQTQIDAYLGGAASVIGLPRVGIYGGYWIVKRCIANKTADWFWQTSAWSYNPANPIGPILTNPENTLLQYAYNQWIGGTNCDAVQAYALNYGQASKFPLPPPPAPPAPPAPPVYPKPTLPAGPSANVLVFTQTLKALADVTPRVSAARSSAQSADVVKKGQAVAFAFMNWSKKEGAFWLIDQHGNRYPANVFFA